jgi:hypothetical protein
MKYQQILKKLKSQANKKNVEGMARFGINTKNTLGISISARWIAADALRELTSDKVQKRLKKKKK